ncbi:hypothetical protein ACHAW5_005350 [Stephanodiscus triporus]|uniref:DUF6824 domain-containing protein n=1 Tax=Stephanodiscus triporus TaxID=2934178 RepID=A0ABD3N617_9STRA
MSPTYETVEAGLSKRDQFAASNRDRLAAASSSGQSLMSMGCSGRSLLSMDLGLRSQDFEGGYGSLINSGDFDYDADDEFKTSQDSPLPDINAGNHGMTTSEYEEPLTSLPEDQEHKPCPVIKLTAKLERCSTCESVDLLNEKFRVTSRDWGIPVPQSEQPLSNIKNYLPVTDWRNDIPAVSRGHDGHEITRQASSYDKITPNVAAVTPLDASSTSSIKNKITKPRRLIDVSYSVEPKDDDVLLGRGGFTNTHPGNIKFRNKALELRPWYEQSDKEQKFAISKVLLESVTDNGNRFLERGDDGLWHEVNEDGARKKASQALRERIGRRRMDAA